MSLVSDNEGPKPDAPKTASDPDPGSLLFDGADWSFKSLSRAYDAIERVALDDLGLNVYPNQVEIISTEQMLDAYSSFGMPLMYRHWSFGKHFAREEKSYRQGHSGLAYEIVINANPCISYNLEDNTMALQALVMAHAAFGHNHFFKNNYLFKQWTDADGVLDYFQYAKAFITGAEERHGLVAVEETLDAAHAIMEQGVFRYRRAPELTPDQRQTRKREIEEYRERTLNDLWRTVPEAERAAV
ncbi:MAG: SpoVR family protein, partial [Alphaproteobacteria bacterium]|nr:SpoVR family protein [Alphaproteobacteria bacterium]